MHKFISWLILPCCLTLLTGCNEDEDNDIDNEDKQETTTARRTVLMYVSAQNSLGYKGFQESDSIEISNTHHLIDDNDRLLVFMDDEQCPRLYRYSKKNEKPQLLRQWETDVNSADPKTLQDVLSWTKANFPAEEYGLVMWSHSDGWLPSTNKNYGRNISKSGLLSFGIDVGENGNMKYDEDANEETGAQMDITDMAAAIQKSGIYFSYIFFDSCLMQNLETAYTLKDVTDYVIGAPMQIPGCGANYTHMIQKGLFSKAEYDIVDTYTADATKGFDDINNEYYDYGIVISSIRTDKLDELARTTATLLPKSLAANRSSVDMSDVLNYQAYTSYYFHRPHNYDAQEAMRKLLSKEDFQKFSDALNEVIVNKGATQEFWIGPGFNTMKTVDLDHYSAISMFIPQDVYSQNSYTCPFGDLNEAFQSTSWYNAAGWVTTGW